MTKIVNISLALTLAVIGLIVFLFKPPNTTTQPISDSAPPNAITQNVTLIVNTGTPPPLTFNIPHSASESAFTILEKTATQQNLEFKYQKYSFGNLVENISGFTNSPEKSWIYFVNNTSPPVGASDYLLNPGDVVEWKYVKPE